MKTIRFPRRAVLLGGLAAFLSGCASKFRSYGGPEVTRVRLYKGQRLLVLDGADRVLQTYPVGLGFAPEGHKQFEGDGRTPEGAYVVDKRNPDSTYHLSVGISYRSPLRRCGRPSRHSAVSRLVQRSQRPRLPTDIDHAAFAR